MYCRKLARIAGAIVRGVYVPRVNHLGVISRPLAPTDITAIDCDLLPTVVQLQFFGHRRLLALRGHTTYQCSHGRWHLLALQSEHANRRVSFCKHNKLTTTNKDHIID